MDIFRDPNHVHFEKPSSPYDDGKESLGCLPPGFENDLALIPGSFNDRSSTDFPFPSPDIHDSWKGVQGFMLPDFELELKKFARNIETIKDNPQDNFKSYLSPLAHLRESLSGKESLGIVQIDNLDTSFGESSLNPLNDTRDILMRLNTAHIFNKSAGLDISSGTQAALIAPRKIIQSDSTYLPSSTTPIYSLSKSPFPTQLKPQSRSFLTDMDDTVFKEKIVCNPQENVDETLGNLSCIVKDSSMVYLDCTPQPDWPSDLENSSQENTRLKPIDVFKQIDKKVPAVLQLQNQKTTDTVFSQHGENEITKHSSVANSREHNHTNDSTPEELLQMISKILSKSNISVEQKSKGQMMILQLSEILCSTKSSSSAGDWSSKCAANDSGNASKQYSQSFEKDKYDLYEVLDLSRKSYETVDQDEFPKNPVNLSVVSNDKKKLKRALSHPNIKSKAVEKNTAGPETDVSRDKCKSVVKVNVIAPTPTPTTNLHRIQMRLNSKPSNITQKGPLKAVIPVRDMRRGSSITPEKPVSVTSAKKAVTPAQDSKLKPLAASTPTAVNKDNALSKMKTAVSMGPSEKSRRPLLPNSVNKDSKQGSCSNKKDIKFPSSRMSLTTYEASTSKLKQNSMSRRSLGTLPLTNKVQKLKKLDKENIPK